MSLSGRVVLFSLFVLRIVLCLLPQHGYIQPDEFFQFTEPAAERTLQCRTYLPWELTRAQPIRSMFFPVIIAQTVFQLTKIIVSEPSAYILLVGPRLVITLLSFICDWSLHAMLRILGRRERQALFSKLSLASSYVFLTYMTHTFSNSIETILFSLLLVNVMKFLQSPSNKSSDLTGALLALGFFNRPTFLGFAAVPILWAVTGGSISSFSVTRVVRVTVCLSRSFILVAVAMVIWDTNYYTDLLVDFWNIPGTDYWDKLVICPINFIAYNSQTSNLAQHGLHPRYLHLLNLFLLLGVLAFPFYHVSLSVILSALKSLSVPAGSSKQQEMWLTFTAILSLSLLMIFPHQEPRFLIPVTVIACTLVGDRLSRKRFLIPWLVFNICFTMMYGFVHQAGVTRSLFAFNQMIQTKEIDVSNASIIFSSMYLPPQHLMNAPRDLALHDLSIADYPESLMDQLEVARQTTGTIFLAAPSCLGEGIKTITSQLKFPDMQLYRQFFPHFSHEVFVHSWNTLMTSGNVTEAFSLNIWKIDSS